ncbi:hypothetical protein BASA62_010400 [Batrachochytrium salamandrivorans]|nr:hypothetical protein BASA62_010400 [Batrachochytrium salamandrivorans]
MEELDSSKLGTKEHWDDVYETEVDNFVDHGEEGEIWFGQDSVEKMVAWVQDHVTDLSTPTIDLGCGNGHLLFELEALGYTHLVGVDYSEKAVELAQHISASHTPPSRSVFARLDILSMPDLSGTLVPNSTSHLGRYKLALDKGTLDAISLSASTDAVSPADVYVQTVASMLEPGGVLLITSCNWTEPELIARFCGQNTETVDAAACSGGRRFEYMDRVTYPVFRFGGAVGQTITTIALRRL